ncbi:LuxR C-terminal-related transcriptional regulator [Sphingobium cloacae]|uniref:CheY-like response regulator n=1 Tax=Sphingobium cloacae TaxID=120107 RepID=A0A1E1F550_9SPHN|nr:response regulator transcription factor [Sphingobium cloacae]BAV65627.1 CheY-like response regulator [Sphingobium cloacae]
MADSIDVIVVARNSITREGLVRILAEENLRVLQSVSSIEEMDIPSGGGPEPIILVEASATEGEGHQLAPIKERMPHAHIVVLADSFDFNGLVSALRQGADGLVVSEISCESLIRTLNLVAMGAKVLPSQLADNLPSFLPQAEQADPGQDLRDIKLSPQETGILRCLVMGYPNKLASRCLQISEPRVKVHVKAVLRKIGVKNRTQAAIWAAHHGLTAFDLPAAENQIAPTA